MNEKKTGSMRRKGIISDTICTCIVGCPGGDLGYPDPVDRTA